MTIKNASCYGKKGRGTRKSAYTHVFSDHRPFPVHITSSHPPSRLERTTRLIPEKDLLQTGNGTDEYGQETGAGNDGELGGTGCDDGAGRGGSLLGGGGRLDDGGGGVLGRLRGLGSLGCGLGISCGPGRLGLGSGGASGRRGRGRGRDGSANLLRSGEGLLELGRRALRDHARRDERRQLSLGLILALADRIGERTSHLGEGGGDTFLSARRDAGQVLGGNNANSSEEDEGGLHFGLLRGNECG